MDKDYQKQSTQVNSPQLRLINEVYGLDGGFSEATYSIQPIVHLFLPELCACYPKASQ